MLPVAADATPLSQLPPGRSESVMSLHRSSSSIVSRPKSQKYMDSLVPPTPDGYERIASVQKEREEEQKRKTKQKRQSLRSQHSRGGSTSTQDATERTEAARTIQKTFRGYRARRKMQGYSLDPNTRWVTAIREAQFREMNRPRARSKIDPGGAANLQPEGANDQRPMSSRSARDNWRKVSAIARRAGHDDLLSDSSSSESSDEGATPEEKRAYRAQRERAQADQKDRARMMGLQYFLEMVDLKHRYGSNLRMYHEEWKKADTNENFFYWLDYGEGKNIELDTCPRDRLEREQVRYLSREERRYYLVDIDEDGRLCWAKNGERIDTTERYRDSIHGVVPSDDPTPSYNPELEPEGSHSPGDSSSSRSSLESQREADRAAKYTNSLDHNEGLKKVTHISASTIFNKLLRKSVKKNTWIFVADTSFRLYVGIKNSGAFQQSSFLQGSRITAAGLIKVKNGRLSSLSPLSGHYRPPASNFRAFVRSLKENGVDTSHVSISKSYAVLVGLEAYIKTRRKGKDLVEKVLHGKEKLVDPEEVKRKEEEQKDKSESAEKERQALEQEERKREENRTSVRVMQKLGVVPIREPDGQRDEGGGETARV